MKYLVNKETKEHIVFHADVSVPYPQWSIVEADSEGWIPWEGGDCPLPEGAMCEYMLLGETQGLTEYESIESLGTSLDWIHCKNDTQNIVCYRPILETTEKEEPRRHGRTIVHIPESQQSVFDRLKSAIAASESIPAIIAEINALLPEGYCVTRCDVPPAGEPAKQPAEDMSDWRNWREGDLVECISTDYDGAGDLFEISIGDVRPITGISEKFGVRTGPGSWGKTGAYRFHSRPAKVTE